MKLLGWKRIGWRRRAGWMVVLICAGVAPFITAFAQAELAAAPRRPAGDQFAIGHDSHLPADEQAKSVVAILGDASSEGEAMDVVSVLGNTRVTGPVTNNAVSVLGNTYIDSTVEGDAVAVLGDVDLGPHAQIDGNVVTILGALHRDPAAIVHGGLEHVLGGSFGSIDWLQSWVRQCLFKGRLLAFQPGLGWAWTFALGCLLFYACVALLFRAGIDRCVRTVEARPAHCALAGLLGTLLAPVLIALLCVTIIGIAAVPFVAAALFCVSLFGKAVMLAWFGQRALAVRNVRSVREAGEVQAGAAMHPAVAVLVGGAIVLLLYAVPIVGLLTYKLLGFLGFGAAAYTLIEAARSRRLTRAADFIPAAPASAAAPIDAAGSSAAAASPSPQVLASLPRAGFWIRMCALLIDVLLIGIALRTLGRHSHAELLVLAIYGAVMWKMRGSTVGGIVLDLRVVRLDGRGIEWEGAIVRALSCFLSLAVCGLGFIWIAFDPARQAWHDKIAGTIVVRVPRA